MTTRIPTTAKSKVRTIQRADGQHPIKVRVARRTDMTKILEAAPIYVSSSDGDEVTTSVAEQLKHQEMLVRWGIVDWGPDDEPEHHEILGDIAPADVYDDLTDAEVEQVGDIVQGGQLSEDQAGN